MSITIDESLINEITAQVDANLSDISHTIEMDYLVIANAFEPLQRFAASEKATTMYVTGTDFAAMQNKQMFTIMSGQQSQNMVALFGWGRGWFERLKEKIKSAFCSSEAIRKFFIEGTALKDFVTKVLPIIIAAIGLGAINPILLAAIVAIITALIKAGYQAVCPV